MIDIKQLTFRIDTEFSELIQSCDTAYYTNLEEDIFNNGCHEPLLTWNSLIIDGHKRYGVCQKWNIPFDVKQMEFRERMDAISYICSTQLKRPDLVMEMMKYLIGKKYQAESEIRQRDASPQNSSYVFRNNIACNKHETARIIGSDFSISHATVMKYDAFASAVDFIKQREPAIASRILSGKVKVSHENTVELSRLPKEDLKCLRDIFTNNKMDHIGYSEIRHELQWKRIPVSVPRIKVTVNLPLKKIPKYDPDAEISSLSLTIPSWVSSIKRSGDTTDFASISTSAKTKVTKQLFILEEAIKSILKQIEEAK
ncbi:hypothetical protein EDD76_102238 [Kineothrix alysoides]|uniref:ParB-like nuclease family protein n=1 Tax=Kineothrix alysoides TaxID=1469948 RepID=A0A4R1R548_9FIRM|nr:hypothetical protein [Kineothrix alysoides]TCL60540.1 hypothetical protein EDD76_102238 [Kineothrix alysoides]